MKESKGPEMNGERTAEGSGGINNQPRTRWLKKSKGANECKGFACLRGTTNPNSCSAKEEWGANDFDECVPERQQELELVFGI